MSERDFWDIIPRAFFNKMTGYHERKKQDYQDGWERARWMVTVLANFSGKTAKKRLRPRDIIEFEWDRAKKSKSKKEIDSGAERFKQLRKKWQD